MNQPLRILLIDDNPDDRARVAHELKRDFSGIEIEQAGDSNGLERALSGSGYDLVITEHELEWTDGLQVLRAIKARNPDCPVIMFTGGGEHTAVTAMKAGFDDYIVKAPAHIARLSLAVRQTLDRAAARYHSLFENLPIGLYRITPNGRILDANPALAAIAGCPDRKTLLTHNAREFYISEQNYRAWQAQLEAHDTVMNFEGPGRKLDGQTMWLRNSAHVVRDHQGRTMYYEGALEDITLEKQAVEKLHESDRQLTTLISNLPGYVYRVANDPDYTPLFISEGVVRVTGYAQSEYLVDRSISCGAEIHPEDKDNVWQIVQQAVEAGEPYECEYRIHTKQGELKWLWEHGRGTYSQAGELLFLEGFVTDVTERTRVAEQARKLSGAIEQAGDSVIIADRDGLIEYVNPAFEINTGYSSAETLGRNPSLMKSGRHDQDFYRGLWDTILRGEPFCAVFTNRRKDGNLYYEEKTITPLRDASGAITHFVSTGKDISERIHAQESLRASEEHLRTIINTNPECIKLVGADGRLIEMNAAGLAMIEADSLEQVAGHSILALILPEHHTAFQALSNSVFQGNRGVLEFEIQGLKGTRRWLETHAVPMTTRSGETVLLGISRDITEHRRVEQRLSYLAHHDELTGLPNRALFNDRLNQAMIDAERHERLVGVVFLDLDRFKDVNDTLGHEAGDLLLKGVAERLLGAVRRGDTVARLSGDEFTIVLADMAHVDDASRVAQKILDIFAQPFHIAGRDLFINASIGITIFPFDTRVCSALLRNADVAMYRAKEAGRNMYQFYAMEMTAKAVERLDMENALRRALRRGEFVLHYQPIVSCREDRIIGVEALIRWQSTENDLVPPMQFISAAEETGLIVPIGEWVLHSACAQLAHWQSIGFSELRLAVNLSPRQFQKSGVAQIVARALSSAGLDPRHLELEITESVLAQGAEAEALLREISATGVKFSIDDFGTGYSSLSYLKRFPIDSLKIDRSFVRDIPGDADDSAIAMAIIAMAHSLGIRVVAEGVETAEQLGFLCAQACDNMQGYYLSKPLPAEAITALLREKHCICALSGDKAKPRGKVKPRGKAKPRRKT